MTRGAILTLNAGSSSLKFGVYDLADEPAELATGQVENLGPAARLIARHGDRDLELDLGAADHKLALEAILARADGVLQGRPVLAVGHRVAHGGLDYTGAEALTPHALDKLRALAPLAPLHQPHNLAAIDAAIAAFPDAVQIACFDTAFHRGHPWVNDTFALPRRFYDQGVRRYGFHGVSYQFVTQVLAETEPALTAGRVVIAHLGNGASICGVREGRSMASTMGFSALDGLPMGTRCGQLDPGVLLYLMEREGMTAAEITTLLYKESGLKGLSGMTHDLRALEASDRPEAAEAIDYFTFRIRREVGAMAAILGGIDGLVFCGGIGENSRTVREKVCVGMEWLGLHLDTEANAQNAREISTGPVRVLVIPTDEERVIARAAARALSG
ncbi:MAG: acetate/propionate family kinase [Pseudomonadota bacterium]